MKSLLDIDLYKLLMLENFFLSRKFKQSEYKFFNRKNVDLSLIKDNIKKKINDLENMIFTKDEIDYLISLNLFCNEFLDYLKLYVLEPSKNVFFEDGELYVRGHILDCTFYEIYILSIISEEYTKSLVEIDEVESMCKLEVKIDKLLAASNPIKITEFGTRRRASFEWQGKVIEKLAQYPQIFAGTSNLYYAKKYNLKPIGTMAHEYVCAYQAVSDNVLKSDIEALKDWKSKSKIALTDTLTTQNFCRNVSKEILEEYDGLRHDSGDPFKWGFGIINLYEYNNVDIKSKTMVFSDGLDIDLTLSLNDEFYNDFNLSFGIGTNLTNDVGLKESLNFVIKLTKVNGKPVIKLSDVEGKIMCVDEDYKQFVQQEIEKEN